jgi:hypothetical protein
LTENIKSAKKQMKKEILAYDTYGYYLAIPIIFCMLMGLSVLGIDTPNLGMLLTILTVAAHIKASKLKISSLKILVAPMLFYISNVVSLLLLPALFSDFSNGIQGDTYFILIGLIVFPMQILMLIFFIVGALSIKKAYPTMKEDAKQARANFCKLKNTKLAKSKKFD